MDGLQGDKDNVVLQKINCVLKHENTANTAVKSMLKMLMLRALHTFTQAGFYFPGNLSHFKGIIYYSISNNQA